MIKENQVEGVVYHVLRGCLVYDYEYSILEEALSEMGIPIIFLTGVKDAAHINAVLALQPSGWIRYRASPGSYPAFCF